MKNTRKRYLFSIIILTVLFGGIVLVLSILWNKPLGPALGLSTIGGEETMSAQQDSASVVESTPTPSSLLSQILGLLQQPSNPGDTICNGPAVMTILVIGSDERADDYLYGLADSIRVVRIDFTTSKAMILDIPRDLWVEIPGIADHYGITHGKLNQAYFFGNPGMGYYDGPGEGPGLLAQTLYQNFGLQVDHYLAVDRTTFVRIIDAIGGIDVKVDDTIDLNQSQENTDPKLVFEPGNHHLDGEMALKIAVNRSISIFQRARYQNIVLRALQDKLLSPAIITQLPQLITQFTQSVQTDLSPSDLNHLVCIGQALTKDNTSIVAFPEDMFTAESTYDPYRKVNTFTLGADFDQLRTYFEEFMNGIWP